MVFQGKRVLVNISKTLNEFFLASNKDKDDCHKQKCSSDCQLSPSTISTMITIWACFEINDNGVSVTDLMTVG